MAKLWKKGDVLAVRVISIQRSKRKLFFSLKLKDDSGQTERKEEKAAEEETKVATKDGGRATATELTVGTVVNGRVTRVLKGGGLLVVMAGDRTGRVHACDVSDERVRGDGEGVEGGREGEGAGGGHQGGRGGQTADRPRGSRPAPWNTSARHAHLHTQTLPTPNPHPQCR